MKRPLQYSLRWLLIAMGIVAVLCGLARHAWIPVALALASGAAGWGCIRLAGMCFGRERPDSPPWAKLLYITAGIGAFLVGETFGLIFVIACCSMIWGLGYATR